MRSLLKYLENPFADKGIGVERLTTFSSDHLLKMSNHNTGGFLTGRIAATTTALAGMETHSSSDQTKLAIRKSLIQAKDNFRRDLPFDIQKVYGFCLGHYTEQGVEMTEIFPEGRGVFTKCKDDGLNNKLDVMIAGVTAHQATLGAPVVALATAVRTNWLAIYGAAEVAVGAKDTTKDQKNAARELLLLELFRNLLTIALEFPGEPEKLAGYMNQSLLESGSGSLLPDKAVITSLTSPADGAALIVMEATGATLFNIYVKAPGAAEHTLLAEEVEGPEYEATGFDVGGSYSFIAEGINGSGAGEQSDPQTVTITKP